MRQWVVAVLGLSVLGAPALQASAITDFSLTNPNGVWSYGYRTALDQPFTPFTISTTDYFGDGQARGWYAPLSNSGAANLPAVLQNTTGGAAAVGTIVYWPADILLMHPGSDGQWADVRYTAPATGSYNVGGFFVGMDNGPTTTTVAILRNGTLNGAVGINGFGPSSTVPFSGMVSLAAGGTLDFLVGYGSNSNYSNDSTGFTASISQVPEPAALSLIGAGLLALPAALSLIGAGLLALGALKRLRKSR
jgi:hypothetical protein